MNQWRPIETAPKDGTKILGWRKGCGILLIRWDCAASFLTDDERQHMDEDYLSAMDWFCADFITGARLEGADVPAHWMLLPEPPQEASE